MEISSKDKIKPYVLVDEADLLLLAEHRWTWRGKYVVAVMSQADGTKRHVAMHRFIVGAEDGQQVDHINRLTYDNRRENLRVVTSRQNNWNRAKRYDPRGTSEYIGVIGDRYGRSDRKWQASIAGQIIGEFEDEVEAAYVRDQAAMQLYGEFAYLNFNYDPND